MSPIGLEDVQASTERALRRLDAGFFKVRTDRMTPREMKISRAMANLEGGPYGIRTLQMRCVSNSGR